jgi:glycosyltransferase involved in cell wall biosynthesis
MTAEGVRFPVVMLHYTAPPVPGGVERTVASQARALARAGYPVRLVAGEGLPPSDDVVLRLVPQLSSSHPRIGEITAALARGEVPGDFEPCVLDLAQALGRELVASGAAVIHNIMTMPFNLPAAEAIHRLARGSRALAGPAGIERRWIVWAHDCAAGDPRYADFFARAPKGKDGPWSLLRAPLQGATYVVPSESRRALAAKVLRLAKRGIEVVPGGVEADDFLDLTPNVRALAREASLRDVDLVLLSPTRVVDRKALSRGLEIVRALARPGGKRLQVRWLVTGPLDPHRAGAGGVLDGLRSARRKLKLEGSVIFLSAEADWARPQVPDRDLRALYRLADVLFLPSEDEGFGLPVLEGALARNVLVVGPAKALGELVRGERGVVALGPCTTPSAAANRILAAVRAAPASGLRRRVLRELDWAAIAERHLVPLVEGRPPGRASRRR